MKILKSKPIKAVGVLLISLFIIGIMTLTLESNKAHADSIQPVAINASTFPDAAFRAYVSSAFDNDGNGILDEDEIILARNIHCDAMGISSLQGIEYLVELRGLYCTNNNISTMDLSHNKLLTGVWCSNNKFTSLDFTPNPDLEWVYCYECNLSSINVVNNPKLAFLEVNTNPLGTLDVSHNPLLEHLTCGSCELYNLDVTHNPNLAHLDAFRNHLTSLDVTHNPKMKRLDVWDNHIDDAEGNPIQFLGNIDISHNPGLQYYNCANNGLTSVDVSLHPELTKLVCSYNDIQSLDLSHNPKLSVLNCEDNQLQSLDLSHNPKLYYLQAAINPFNTLNISNNPYLIKTYREGAYKKEWYGQSWTINYGGEISTGNDNFLYIWANEGLNIIAESTGAQPVVEKYSPLDPGVSEADLLTREQAVMSLYQMAGSPGVSRISTRFSDVEHGAFYENACLWGQKNAICVGFPQMSCDTFGVGKWLTRQDMYFMFMRYSEVMNLKRDIDFGRADDYMDYYDVDYEHWEAVTWAATVNILVGKGEPGAPKEQIRIDPYGRVTRAEFEAVFRDMMEVNGRKAPNNIPIPDGVTPRPAADPDQVRNFVERFYTIILDRPSEPEGLDNWTKALLAGTRGGADVADEFIHSAEYSKKADSDDEYLTKLYRVFFNRDPDAPGMASWKADLAAGKGRDFVLNGFLVSDEYKTLCANYGIKRDSTRTFVKRFYKIILGREDSKITAAELDNWQIALDAKAITGADMAREWINDTPEFKKRILTDEEYLNILYNVILKRDIDPTGLATWSGELARGTSRAQILDNLLASNEFKALCKEYGIDPGK